MEIEKPKVRLFGNYNAIFHLILKTRHALRNAGRAEDAAKILSEAHKAGSYHEVLLVLMQYVEIT